MFANISIAFGVGIACDKGGTPGFPLPDDDKEHLLRTYRAVLEAVPDLSKAIDDANGQTLEEALEIVQEGVTCCCTDDCGSLKWPGLNYVLLNTSALMPSIPPTDTSKSLRSFHHPQLARLLCPHKYISEFDQNPNQYIDRVLNGDLIFKVWLLPSFLYDQTKPYNPDDIQDSLLRGHVLFYKHIFCGRSTAVGASTITTKPSKNKIHSIKEVSEFMIAYAAVMAYFTLSSEEMFRKAAGGLVYGDFYCTIISLFEEKETDPWVKETLAWWNQQIYGNNSSEDSNSDLGSEEEWQAVIAQRAARRRLNRVNSVSIDPVLRGASATASTSSVHNGIQVATTVSSGIALSSAHNGMQTATTVNTNSAFSVSAHNGMQTVTTVNTDSALSSVHNEMHLAPSPLSSPEPEARPPPHSTASHGGPKGRGRGHGRGAHRGA
ncbi:hypothetical protein BKA82DRAFT_23215 [Pisolithus tinctorius]|uniref:Uncharacterized protein n=1 Tax=Pisolithus tinctorius Marx 270 TaxID=870435 RepID=A0A0C3P4I4_PISTI|nr:hypothetical protein BKA82DRAFT_23215 [Pisolithus tinctorius]KIO07955.1 hypothetical protein M404DRAFT_23215 [Pisolithus tinctorius Marx 270]